MQQNIKIEGMTCQGCVVAVSEKLLGLQAVEDLNIDLSNGQAQLEVSEFLTTDQLRAALPKKYTPAIISDREGLETTSQQASKLKQLFPLFLIFTYLIAGGFLLQKNTFSASGFMLDFMGLFFIVFSFFKFLDYKGFPAAFGRYDLLAKRSSLYGKIYPFLETGLGVMFLIRWQLNFALWTTLVILSMTTIGVIYSLLDKTKIDCACLGTALKLPMTEATLIENIIMLVMAVSMIFQQFRYLT